MKKTIVKDLNELKDLAIKIVKKNQNIVLLKGDLGAGKTTLTQFIAKELGVKTRVNSPTFTIMKQHTIVNDNYKNLVHYDLYRLSTIEEVEDLGFFEVTKDKENFVIVEWPELILEHLSKYLLIEIELQKNQRTIVVTNFTGLS